MKKQGFQVLVFILITSMLFAFNNCSEGFSVDKDSNLNSGGNPDPDPDPDPQPEKLKFDFDNPPNLLSETDIFKDFDSRELDGDLQSFDVIQPLWSDYALKSRWFYIPKDKKIEFSPTGFWVFPVGTVLIKQFELEVDVQAGISLTRNMETRVMYLSEDKDDLGENIWKFYTYVWNEEQSEATLDIEGLGHGASPASPPPISVNISDSALGGERDHDYVVPSKNNCMECHNASVGYVRGLKTLQTNFEIDGENQIDKWNDAELFSVAIEDSDSFDAYLNIYEVPSAGLPLEKAARSYLEVNCAHCHNSNGGTCFTIGSIDWDFRADDNFTFGSRTPAQFVDTLNSGSMPKFSNHIDDVAVFKVVDWLEDID